MVDNSQAYFAYFCFVRCNLSQTCSATAECNGEKRETVVLVSHEHKCGRTQSHTCTHTHTYTHTHTHTHIHKHMSKGNGWANLKIFHIFFTLKILLEFWAQAQIRFCPEPKCNLAPGPNVIQVSTQLPLWAVMHLDHGPKRHSARGADAIWFWSLIWLIPGRSRTEEV